MVWTLTKAERLDRVFSAEEKRRFDKSTQTRLRRLQCGAKFTYLEIDENGVTVPGQEPHVYFEPIVTECSDQGLAKLARDHLTQLNKIADLDLGAVEIAHLVTPPAAPAPTQAELDADAEVAAKRANVGAALSARIAHLKAIELGLLASDDASVVDTKAKLDAMMEEDPATVLGFLG